jgi:hypothetical protein
MVSDLHSFLVTRLDRVTQYTLALVLHYRSRCLLDPRFRGDDSRSFDIATPLPLNPASN